MIAALAALALALAPRALAQDAPAEASDDASFEASLAEGAPEGEEAWEQPTLMLVPRHDTPDAVLEDVRALLAETGAQLLERSGYEREARSRGLPPESAEAMQAILPEMHEELDLVIVVGANRPTRPTLVTLTYHDRFGLQILDEVHGLTGGLLSPDSRSRTLAETRLALAVITRPPGGLQQVAGGIAPGSRAPGLAVHVGIEAGVGVGTRELEVPTAAGVISLSAAVFPAAALQLSVDVEPTARGRLTLGADLEYQTSLGLVTTDRRVDGTLRETSSRSQRLAAGLRIAYRFGDALGDVSIAASLLWSALSFTSEAPVSLPDYTLQGPALWVAVIVPIADLVTIELAPEVTAIVDVGGALARLGVSSTGVAIGGSARVRLRILSELFAELDYRESHAFLGTPLGGGTDVERFGTARLIYRP